MLKILTLLLALAAFASCVFHPAPEPEPDCLDLLIVCDGDRELVRVRRYWTETRPPALEMICWVRCDTGTRGCTSTDGCTWLEMR